MKGRIESVARELLAAFVGAEGPAVTDVAVDAALAGAVKLLQRMEEVLGKFDSSGMTDAMWLVAFLTALREKPGVAEGA